MKKLISLLFTCLIFPVFLTAQFDYREGYVIDLQGDTLRGTLDFRGDVYASTVCRFKENGVDKIQVFYPSDIRAYRLEDQRYYKSLPYDNGRRFYEFLIKGKVNLYYLREDKGDTYFVENEEYGMRELVYEEGSRIVDGGRRKFVNRQHIGILKLYMQDTPDIEKYIVKLEKPNHNGLRKLAEKYYELTESNSEYLVYRKPQPWIKLAVEPRIGARFLSGKSKELGGNIEGQRLLGGALLHIYLPRLNEKFFLRTGITFGKLNELTDNNFVRIPIQMEYVYQKGRFRPTIAYGMAYYLTGLKNTDGRGLLPNSNVGFHFKFSEKLFLSAGLESEFNASKFPLLPKRSPSGILIGSNSINLGLFIKID